MLRCIGLKVNADKSKVMVLGEEKGFRCAWGAIEASVS